MLARRALAAAVLALALTGCGRAGAVAQKPPPLEAAGVTWLGADEARDWPALLGNVVYLEFGFLR